MQLHCNKQIKIVEPISSPALAQILTFGNLHVGFASFANQPGAQKFFHETAELKNVVCEIALNRLEKNKDEFITEEGWLQLNGRLSYNKESRQTWISCGGFINHARWTQLKNDLLSSKQFELVYQIHILKFGELIENEFALESTLTFDLSSYELVKT